MPVVHETHKNGILVEAIVDNEDGTGLRSTWAEDGTPLIVDEPVTGLSLPIPESLTVDDLADAILELGT